MSIEQRVRAKQELEANIKGYLKVAAMLNINELELGLARIADFMHDTDDDFDREHYRFRGQVLKAYFDLRSQNQCVQNLLRRKTSWRKYAIPVNYHPLMLEHQEGIKRLWAEYDKKLSKMNPWNRFFSSFRTPRTPLSPRVSESEQLIHSVAVYRLFPQQLEPPREWTPTPETILTLANDGS